MPWLRKRSTILAFLAGAVVMLILILAGSYIAFERAVASPHNDSAEINREFAKKVFIDDLLSFPKRVFVRPDYRPGLARKEIQGDWAIVSVGSADRYSCRFADAGPGLWIFRKVNGSWKMAVGGTKEYYDWLEEVPSSLIAPEIKELLP